MAERVSAESRNSLFRSPVCLEYVGRSCTYLSVGGVFAVLFQNEDHWAAMLLISAAFFVFGVILKSCAEQERNQEK